jgi:hypothetical protein
MILAPQSLQKRTIRASLPSRLAVAVGALTFAVLSTSVAQADVVLRQVDGGPDYYDRFARSLPTGQRYFPIGVWFESVTSQADINLDKQAGLNLYVVLTGNSNLGLIERNGMHAILQQSEWRNNANARNSRAVVGWELADEIDMQRSPIEAFAELSRILASLPLDGRMRYNNYGKGVMFWNSNADAGRYVNDFQHPTSVDTYWFTDPHISGSSEGGKLLNGGHPLTYTQTRRAANYGYTVDRKRWLDHLNGRRKPIWNFIEVGWPFTESAGQGGRAIQPAEVRAAVWHSIIAGARGIIYFNHSFGGPHHTQHALRDPYYANVRAAVKSTNELVTRLAPVLNDKFAHGFVRTNASVRAMAKYHSDQFFIFAGSKENVASTATFRLTGITKGKAKVIGESRTIPIEDGRFSDRFADGNAIHIYRIIKE